MDLTNAAGVVLWTKPPVSEYTFRNYAYAVLSNTAIDTGLAIKSTDYIFVDFETQQQPRYGSIFYAGKTNIVRAYFDGSNVQAKVGWYNTNVAETVIGSRLSITFDRQVVTISNGKSINMSAVPTFTPDTNLIFGGLDTFMLYGFKHGTSANHIDRDYTPAIRNSDGTVGFYEKVQGIFIPWGDAAA